MKSVIFNGSPRKHGNTSELTSLISEGLSERGIPTDEVMLFGFDISGCSNCGSCQKGMSDPYCALADDMIPLYPRFLEADLVIIASPIYMWQFTPCVLAFLNRLHCLCKSSDFSYNLMKGKRIAVALTMGDDEEVADFAVGGLMEMCEFYSMEFVGDIRIPFANREKIGEGVYKDDINAFLDAVRSVV